MQKILSCVVCIGFLSGCTTLPPNQLRFMPSEAGAPVGSATAEMNRFDSGPIEIVAGNTRYIGDWVLMYVDGTTGAVSTYAYGQSGPAFATATGSTRSANQVGEINAVSADGITLRCEIRYSVASYTGLGDCQTSDGQRFRLTIS